MHGYESICRKSLFCLSVKGQLLILGALFLASLHHSIITWCVIRKNSSLLVFKFVSTFLATVIPHWPKNSEMFLSICEAFLNSF